MTTCRTHSILVMTPKILEDRLVCKQVSFWDICLLILDEAHHCSGQHSYAQIMQMYGEAAKPDRPHILGMTASPVKTAATTKEKLTTYLLELEKRMHSKLITIQGQALQKLHEACTSMGHSHCHASGSVPLWLFNNLAM